MQSYWDQVEATLLESIKESYSKYKGPFNGRDYESFSKNLLELHEYFTSNRSDWKGEKPYLIRKENQSAYLLYYFPLQTIKFLTLLHQSKYKPKRKEITVWDLASGPGSATLALLTNLQEENYKIHFHLFDQNESILKEAKKFFKKLNQNITYHKCDITNLPKNLEKPDLILIANGINELEKTKRDKIKSFISENVNDIDFVILEPAFPLSSRFLSELKSEIDLNPVFPCPKKGKCPLLSSQDFCHLSFKPIVESPLIARCMKTLQLKNDRISFSSLIYQGESLPSDPVIVTNPIPAKPKPFLWMCTGDEKTKVHEKDRPLRRGMRVRG